MKKLLIILLTFLSLTLGATRWYVHPGGSDTNGDGSATYPWLTYGHAADTITGANFIGDTIFLDAGTYALTGPISHTVGISVMGVGDATILNCTGTGAYSPWDETPHIYLASDTEGTEGNQSISYLHMNGNDTIADGGIFVYRRSNVKIHNVSMDGFHYYGVRFRGGAMPPAIYATGNELHNCVIYDCGGPNVSYGNVQIGGQEGMLIYNNDIDQPQRPGYNRAGFPIKYLAGGDNHGLKIYGNKIRLEEGDEYDEWHFAVELFGCHGGIEIYNNRFWGELDFSDYAGSFGTDDTEGYGYAVKIYNNVMGGDSPTDEETYGVVFERSTSGGVYIFNNHIKNVRSGISLTNPDAAGVTEDIYIYNNIISSFGKTGSASGYGITIGRLSDEQATNFENINIYNNTIVDNSTGQPTAGIYIRGGTLVSFSNVSIKNNIVSGIRAGTAYAIWFNKVICDTVEVENNNLYNCDYVATTYTDCTITSTTDQNNITTSPAFKSESTFRLTPSSGCVDAGVDVDLDYDYYGHKITGTPDIGAMEYGRYIMKIK